MPLCIVCLVAWLFGDDVDELDDHDIDRQVKRVEMISNPKHHRGCTPPILVLSHFLSDQTFKTEADTVP